MIKMNLHIPGTFNSLFKFLNSINGIFARALSKPVKSKTRTPFFHCEVVCVCVYRALNVKDLTQCFRFNHNVVFHFVWAVCHSPLYILPKAFLLTCLLDNLPFLLLILLFLVQIERERKESRPRHFT